MKDMKKPVRFTDKEWDELASIFSGEEIENQDLVSKFKKDDHQRTGDKWEEIKEMSSVRNVDVDKAWRKVSAKINKNEAKTEPEVKSIRRTLLKIAAAALLLVSMGSGTYYLFNSGVFSRNLTFTTDNDQKNLLVELSDGSRIFLNRNSELSYRSSYGKTDRSVKLTGEAFFEITADTTSPFIIDAGNAQVMVIGTSFNVITSNEASEVEVFVKSGKVVLSESGNRRSVELDPGFVGIINESKTEKNINNNPNYLSWNTGLLVYNGQTLDIVFKDLKRVYNMDIIADDLSILENRWTSPIDNQTRETIIRLICASFNLSYKQDGNVYHLVKK